MSEYKLLDTHYFDEFIKQTTKWNNEYIRIQKQYDAIIEYLDDNWKGKGAQAFQEDAKLVKSNIAGIGDILKTMCDMLYDCKDVFSESDQVLGENNREIGEK